MIYLLAAASGDVSPTLTLPRYHEHFFQTAKAAGEGISGEIR
jgi:hypothetical protein